MTLLTEEQGRLLLELARVSISAGLHRTDGRPTPEPSGPPVPGPLLQRQSGVFVTLHKNGALRGCIGTIEPDRPLPDAVRENARLAAFRDPRFAPLSKEEWDAVDIEVSILTPPEKMTATDPQIRKTTLNPLQDGVIIEKKGHRATFLPQVWEQLPDAEDFLGRLCEKAGLDARAWQDPDTTLFTYQVQSFGSGSSSRAMPDQVSR